VKKAEVILRLKDQRDELNLLIADLEASDSEVLASTPISELSPEQFARLCGEAMANGMKPLVASTAEAAHKVIENAQFEDETARLSNGVRRSRAVVNAPDEDKGN
jgi:hypothetical protein